MPNYRNFWKPSTSRSTSGFATRSRSSSTAKSGWSATSYSPASFSNATRMIQRQIGSFRAIQQQVTGSGRVTAFSPTAANRWIKFVNDGAFVYKFTNNDFCRFFGRQWESGSPSAAFRYLRKKFGAGIKAVTRGKGNMWLIAATQNVSARPFSTYNWN